MPKKMILIRHGQTDWNAAKRYMGSTDVDLNDTGLSQAYKLKTELSGYKIERVFSSSSKRALNFARIIFNDIDIKICSELREMDFGIFEGMSYDEINVNHSTLYRAWIEDPLNNDIPDGERGVDFHRRIIDIFNKIASESGDGISAVVSHGGPIGIFLNHISGAKNLYSMMPETGSARFVECKENGVWGILPLL